MTKNLLNPIGAEIPISELITKCHTAKQLKHTHVLIIPRKGKPNELVNITVPPASKTFTYIRKKLAQLKVGAENFRTINLENFRDVIRNFHPDGEKIFG